MIIFDLLKGHYCQLFFVYCELLAYSLLPPDSSGCLLPAISLPPIPIALGAQERARA